VVGKGVLVDRLIDPIPTGRVGPALALGIHADSLLPEAQAIEHLLDHVAFIDEGHNTHLALAGRADHGIGFLNLLDEIPPFLGGNAAGLVFGHVHDLHALSHLFGRLLLLGVLLPLSTHLIGIPSIIAHKLKALVWDVL
ncbi:hypothetical protein, partial [Limnospira sp. Paracas R14]|uniref:hypothetical protein n=1 Tax=Limnospira sp. Paracas R14 TaxID=2981108 RepID=UPI0028E0B8AA|nr:hypothetical protein [Limnospira sp. Paracas R14]